MTRCYDRTMKKRVNDTADETVVMLLVKIESLGQLFAEFGRPCSSALSLSFNSACALRPFLPTGSLGLPRLGRCAFGTPSTSASRHPCGVFPLIKGAFLLCSNSYFSLVVVTRGKFGQWQVANGAIGRLSAADTWPSPEVDPDGYRRVITVSASRAGMGKGPAIARGH